MNNPPNLSASVHQRLLNLRDESGQDFNRLLVKYALERLLYRVSKSDYAGQFAQYFTFEGETLVAAIRATFDRRETTIPKDFPVGLSQVFAEDDAKVAQWQAFLRRISPEVNDVELGVVIEDLRTFVGPPLFAAARNELFQKKWQNGGPWISMIV